jgi:hypothetical protein
MRLAFGSSLPLLLFSSVVLLVGCATNFDPDPTPFATQTAIGTLTGSAFGGRQPISGAQIYLFAAGTEGNAGYNSSGTLIAASSTNASVSLLNSNASTAQDTNSADPTYGDYYVTTNANGAFSITGDYTCTAGTQLYLYSIGGNPGSGTNTAASLMAVLGQCPSSGSLASQIPFVSMTEASTVAAAYALAGFATDAVHISSDSGVSANAWKSLSATGIANAFINAANLFDITASPYANPASGALATTLSHVSSITQVGGAGYTTAPTVTIAPPPNGIQATAAAVASGGSLTFTITNPGSGYATTPAVTLTGGTYTTVATATSALAAGNAAAPQTTLNALANSLAACVNSTGPSSTQCTTLFEDATSNGSTCSSLPCTYAPSETATAAINIAHHPGTNVSALFNLTTGIGTPYQPALGSAPNDFTIGLTFTGGGITNPCQLAIDVNGNAWIANYDNPTPAVIEIAASGPFLSGASGFTNGITQDIYYMAIDSSGNAWVTTATNYVFILSPSGSPLSGTSGYSISGPSGIQGTALDASNHLWIASGNNSKLYAINSSGSVIDTFTGGGIASPNSPAIDGDGNIWVGDNGSSGALTEYSSSGTVRSGGGSGSDTGASLNEPFALAADASGNIWVANFGSNTVSKFSNAGSAIAAYSGAGLDDPLGIAIDGAGNVWVANRYGSRVSEFSNSGSAISPTNGYQGGKLNTSTLEAIAIDGSGNVWLSNPNVPSVTELIGAAVPVITPLAAGLPSTPTANGTSNLGTRP